MTLALVLLAHPLAVAASDVFSNVAPQSQVPGGGLASAYPLGNYALDQHFPGVKASITGGVDVSGVPPLIAYFLADVIWQLTAFLANALITLFTFAFSLDLVNGSSATGGAGALAPVSNAVRHTYSQVFGGPWLAAAVVLAGLWAMWKALVQRRYTETAGALGLSLVFVVIALAFVIQPERTIGQASRWTNAMSGSFLSVSSRGTPGDEQQAKRQSSDQLFSLLVYEPWVVLDFGGREHCVKRPIDGDPEPVAVRPLANDAGRDVQLSDQLRAGTQVEADAKTCINDRNKYAPHFLRYAPGSDERNSEYDALNTGDSRKLPDSDPGKKSSYKLGPADKPAADAMEKGGQYQRLLLAVVIFLGELGAFLLLGSLSVAVILAQVVVLLLLAFAPIALVAAVFPGRGHDFFRAWLSRLAAFLLRKAIYSLILAVLLAVAAALADASANLGWLMSFGLQAVFFWTVYLYRHRLLGQFTAATAGAQGQQGERLGRLASAYYATNLLRHARSRRRARSARRPTTTTGGAAPPAPPAPSAPAPPPDTGGPAESAATPTSETTTGAAPPAGAPPATLADPRAPSAAPPRATTPAGSARPQAAAAEAGATPARTDQPPGADAGAPPAPAGGETPPSPIADSVRRDRDALLQHRGDTAERGTAPSGKQRRTPGRGDPPPPPGRPDDANDERRER